MGPETEQFESEFAQYLGAKHAVAVSSGTAALHLALLALGIGPGDEVIVPSLTFVATANSVLYVGAKPVFADITSIDDWNISPDEIERKNHRQNPSSDRGALWGVPMSDGPDQKYSR